MRKFEFQAKAQDELVAHALQLLGRTGRSVITFKAPTGAGKTVMMANALSQLTKEAEGTYSLAIIWVAPNKLHEQSLKRAREVYGSTKALDCLLFEELSGTDIPDRTVLFLNWSSIDSEKLVLRRDNETRRNLESVINQSRTSGRKIVLVVDESHLHLNSGEQAQVVVDHILKPDLLIEVSATPRANNPDYPVTVLREAVLKENLIRKRVVVNPGEAATFEGTTLVPAYGGTSESLLDAALEKQAELTRLFKAEDSAVIPLILVQLPDQRNSSNALERFEEYLHRRHQLSRGKGVAVWLSEDRTPDVDDIAAFGSSVRVLFFKHAAATGWDCPRAQILVGLREMKSETFTTQVLGRIIRQPEHKAYQSDELNYAYAFTNYEKLELDAETASWMGKVLVRAQQPFFLGLPNWHDQRSDRRGHLTYAAVDSALAHFDCVKDCVHQGPVLASILSNQTIENIDGKQSFRGTREIALDLKALQDRLDRLKGELVKETAGQNRGLKYVEKALRDAACRIAGTESEAVVLETILHKANEPLFRAMVGNGIRDFLETQEKAAREIVTRDSWAAPETRFLELSAPLEGYSKCLYKPILTDQFLPSDVEEPFSRLLDRSALVEVWMKNGDNGREHFALKYEFEGEWHLFYVDFLVKTTNGGLRLFETKGSSNYVAGTGNTDDTHAKARALFAYVAEQKAKGVDIEAGIVVYKEGQWWLHSGRNYPGTKDFDLSKGWLVFHV